MNANICHLQVSHSQTLIQPRAGCGKAGGRQMELGEGGRTSASESETVGGKTETRTAAGLKSYGPKKKQERKYSVKTG